jgi:hypothetical protein
MRSTGTSGLRILAFLFPWYAKQRQAGLMGRTSFIERVILRAVNDSRTQSEITKRGITKRVETPRDDRCG